MIHKYLLVAIVLMLGVTRIDLHAATQGELAEDSLAACLDVYGACLDAAGMRYEFCMDINNDPRLCAFRYDDTYRYCNTQKANCSSAL